MISKMILTWIALYAAVACYGFFEISRPVDHKYRWNVMMIWVLVMSFLFVLLLWNKV